MLAIRMQRTGRKGHAQFRVIVQDSHRSPSTGKVIEYLGSYNPHTKEASLKKENIEKYMANGAQPSNRVAILLKKEGVKLPNWVTIDTSGSKSLKNPDKLRKNQPDEPKEEKPAEETPAEEEVAEKPAEEPKDEKAEETPEDTVKEEVKEEPVKDEPAKEKTTEETKDEPKEEKAEEKTDEKPADEPKEEK